ncbi:MAG: gliding motility-associated C-terminal domain-containing protein [Bacteroidales bacterium]|nr:gliding motility-associated C-terminal domain-containing protein [Bacteroidales bacterium]
MVNGNNLIGSEASSQGALILQKPGYENIYYVFTLAFYGDLVGLHYSVVDMNLDGGLGAVTSEKNIELSAGWDAMEKLTSAKHANGRDIWLVTRKFIEDSYASFLLTPSGINSTPVISPTMDRIYNQPMGSMKISPNKHYLISAYMDSNAPALKMSFEICSFDASTGKVDLLYTITKNENTGLKLFEPNSVEFSPDSKLLYLTYYNEQITSDSMELFQYDMQLIDDSLSFRNSEIKIATGPVGGLQLARDGKIYSTSWTYQFYNYVSVINEPWKRGTDCNFEPNAISLESGEVFEFLPNILLDYLYRFEWDAHCSGKPITFQPNFTPEPDHIRWSFSDPGAGADSISTELSPVHYFEQPGSYEVVVNVYYPPTSGNPLGRHEKTSRVIDIIESPHPDLGPDTLLCEGTPVTLNAGNEPGMYVWSNGTLGQTSITVVDTGIYWVNVTNSEGCQARDSIHVGWYNQAVLNETNLVITPTSCGSSNGSIIGLTIEEVVPVLWGWYDGMGNLLGNNLDIINLPVGNYFLHVTDDHGCVTISDSYTITDAGNILIDSVNFLSSHCLLNNGNIQVFANTVTGVDYFYSIDDGNSWQDQPLFENLAPGSYLVRVKDNGACETVFDNNPVIILKMEGPQASAVSTPETDNLLNGSIQITAVVSSGDITYSIDNGTTLQVNNGLFTGLVAGFYTCLVQDGFGCDTTFIVEVEHLTSQTIEAIAGNGYTCIGNATTCPLLINNFMEVDSFHVTLFYDPALVECTGYFQIHPELEAGFQASLFPDLGEIHLSWKGEQPLSLSDTTMVTLVFTAWGEGHPELNWLNDQGQSRFFDASGNEISAILQRGIIEVSERPELIPAGTKSICAGESLLASPIVINEGAGELSYQWIAPNGDSSSIELLWINNMTTQQAGKYSITVTDAVYCEDSDTLLVIVGTGPSIAFSGYDTLFVEPGYILDAGNDAQSYWWNTGDTTTQIAIDSIGQYLVLATSFENCKSTDSVYILWAGKSFFIPNAFTPNGDGLNDIFGVIPRLDYINQYRISIFNRWGQMIFETTDLNLGWDGTYQGEACLAGAYVYRIVYNDFGMGTQETKVMEGTVMLVR